MEPGMNAKKLELDMDEASANILQNHIDMSIHQTLLDSLESGEPLRVTRKKLYDSKMQIERMDIDDSVILKLICKAKE